MRSGIFKSTVVILGLVPIRRGSLPPPHLQTFLKVSGDFGLTGLAVRSCRVFPFLPLPGATILDIVSPPRPEQALGCTKVKQVQAEAIG